MGKLQSHTKFQKDVHEKHELYINDYYIMTVIAKFATLMYIDVNSFLLIIYTNH